jgi:hypothetical protein
LNCKSFGFKTFVLTHFGANAPPFNRYFRGCCQECFGKNKKY